MDVEPHEPEEKTIFTVLVTGANSGLGFAICCRLVDEFLLTRPQSQSLHLLFTTRDVPKSEDTLRRLNFHLQQTLRKANAREPGISSVLEARIKLEGVQVDLLKLSTVKSLAEQLLRRGAPIDAIVCNAGIAGWTGLDWPRAIWNVCTDLLEATTYPTYMLPDLGLAAKAQLPAPSSASPRLADGGGGEEAEPILGQVFTANVFGHYLLTHYLSPLLSPTSRIIWISSISAVPAAFSPSDPQSLNSPMPYEGTKRLTDLLVLTSNLPSTAPYLKTYLPSSSSEGKPKMYLSHPGVISTSISNLHWFLALFMSLAFYASRALGSPWHNIDPYTGAASTVFCVLSAQLPEAEARAGKGKWGSATTRAGEERVGRTEVEGWGFCGVVGEVPEGSVTGGRARGRRETTGEGREGFEVLGRGVWRDLEALRGEWEGRLGGLRVGSGSGSGSRNEKQAVE